MAFQNSIFNRRRGQFTNRPHYSASGRLTLDSCPNWQSPSCFQDQRINRPTASEENLTYQPHPDCQVAGSSVWFHPDRMSRRRPRLSYSRWNMMISSRYKTELCRQFSEDGDCSFDDKCLFAHGQQEVRPLPRHPKYKTELCRDFHQVGFCSFGPRCNFVHSTTDVATLSAKLQEKERSSTPDSGNESCDEPGSSSISPTLTLDSEQNEDTFYHIPESLYRELNEDN